MSNSSDIAALVALVLATIAFLGMFVQIIQHYADAMARYQQCGPAVIGEWAQYTRRLFRPYSLRFEVHFETPVFFLAAPTNIRKHIPDQPIYYIEGTQESYKLTRIMPPREERESDQRLSVRKRIHLADNERASWIELLAAAQRMEHDSSDWQMQVYYSNPGKHPLPKFSERTLAIAIQARRRSWNTMPASVTKPYATTTFAHLVELAAVLGLHWKEFSRYTDRYRAEGNGYLLIGAVSRDLGLVFTFQKIGESRFTENRVIPNDEVKQLCFGVVPTLFSSIGTFNDGKFSDRVIHEKRFKDSRYGMVARNMFGVGDVPMTLRLGSRNEVGKTLKAIGLNKQSVDLFQTGDVDSHLFPVVFELVGMLGRTMHAYGSLFRMLPNPTMHSWNGGFSAVLWALLIAFQRNLEKSNLQLQNGNSVDFDRRIRRIFDANVDKLAPAYLHVTLLDELHKALDDVDSYLQSFWSQDVVVTVLRSHLQQVVMRLNGGAHNSSMSERIDQAWPWDAPDILMDIYFQEIREDAMRAGFYEHPLDGANIIWVALVFRMLCWLLLHTFHEDDVQISKSELLGTRLPVYIA